MESIDTVWIDTGFQRKKIQYMILRDKGRH